MNRRAHHDLDENNEELRLLGFQSDTSSKSRSASGGLPLHRDMSNLELHESTAASRRRGVNNDGSAGHRVADGTGTTAVNGAYSSAEKDYLLDRDPNSLATSKSTSSGIDDGYNSKEKDKWSRLIPTELAGGRAAPNSGSQLAAKYRRRPGFAYIVSLSRRLREERADHSLCLATTFIDCDMLRLYCRAADRCRERLR